MKNNSFRTAGMIGLKGLFIFISLLTVASRASAQKSLITGALTKYGVDQSFLDPATLRIPADRAFDLRESTTAAGKTKVIQAKFDPSGAPYEKWTVVSVDGKAPSKYETNIFRSAREKSPVDKPDNNTYKIDSETADQLVISYKLDATSIPRDAPFLKDCRAVLTVDLKTRQITQLALVNEKPVKIDPLTANKFVILTKYFYDNSAKRYFPSNDNLNMEASFLGKTITTQVETVYSNYTKSR